MPDAPWWIDEKYHKLVAGSEWCDIVDVAAIVEEATKREADRIKAELESWRYEKENLSAFEIAYNTALDKIIKEL